MAVETAQLESYLESFTGFAKDTAAITPRWLRDLRDNAFARFCAVGFPTTRDEDWRFTNVAALARTPFRLACASAIPLAASELISRRMEGATARMVFVDGRFAPK